MNKGLGINAVCGIAPSSDGDLLILASNLKVICKFVTILILVFYMFDVSTVNVRFVFLFILVWYILVKVGVECFKKYCLLLTSYLLLHTPSVYFSSLGGLQTI